MKLQFPIMALMLVSIFGGREAVAGEESCRACHSMDTTLVGPPFRAVAARYKDDQLAIEKLKKSMLEGSSGKWGSVAMPPNQGLTREEAERFAHWVMSLNTSNAH
ncbi:c-type cytochrome [Collimonas antrihumi]|uniref:c-type cytochrome n=1 Tax=Collimonas antrihumi TaxID=1940615 RepID=UPI001B8D9999|nr:c-type cytochrome [Collimonas antrihumi]